MMRNSIRVLQMRVDEMFARNFTDTIYFQEHLAKPFTASISAAKVQIFKNSSRISSSSDCSEIKISELCHFIGIGLKSYDQNWRV